MNAPGSRLALRTPKVLRARLDVHARGAGADVLAGCVPIPGSDLMLALRGRPPVSAFRVEPTLCAPRLGSPSWARGLAALVAGDMGAAGRSLSRAEVADASFLAAGIALVRGSATAAQKRLEESRASARELGNELRRSSLGATLFLTAPGGLVARIRPERRGVLLALLLLEHARRRSPAVLDDLVRMARGDVGVRLMACHLLLAGGAPTPADARRILGLSEGERGDRPASVLLLLFRARSLRCLGRAGAARDLCGATALRAAGRHGAGSAALRLEHVAALRDLGDHAGAERRLRELERLHPRFVSHAARHGIELDVEART